MRWGRTECPKAAGRHGGAKSTWERSPVSQGRLIDRGLSEAARAVKYICLTDSACNEITCGVYYRIHVCVTSILTAAELTQNGRMTVPAAHRFKLLAFIVFWRQYNVTQAHGRAFWWLICHRHVLIKTRNAGAVFLILNTRHFQSFIKVYFNSCFRLMDYDTVHSGMRTPAFSRNILPVSASWNYKRPEEGNTGWFFRY